MSPVSRMEHILPVVGTNAGGYLYANSIKNILRQFLTDEHLYYEEQETLFNKLPLIRWSSNEDKTHLSVFLLCRQRPNAAKFFYEMLSRWLVPGKRLDFSLFFATDFQISGESEDVYTIAEIAFLEEDKKIANAMQRNLPLIEMEIRLGIASTYHANRILEGKGLSLDEKTAMIQEMIASLIRRRPQDFDYDLFSQMQHFLVMCEDEFKTVRECKQMCRIIYVFYLFRRAIRLLVEEFPKRRHLSFKLSCAKIHLPFGVKKVLSLFVGMNFLKENELFEEMHLVDALSNYIPGIRAVKDSFFASRSREDKIHTLYLEVEKENGDFFSIEEISKLRRALPEDLKGRVEQLIRPVFMPRNEEEVMRNLLILSKQLKYMRDLPQMIISFDEQSDIEISFLVMLVRRMEEGDLNVKEKLQEFQSDLKFHVDRIKKMGMIRNKYQKEGSVFRVHLSNKLFLRKDHSVDLYKARQKVVEDLQKIFGEMRDYNGGMISKQIEAFCLLKLKLGEIGRQHDFLLENFFHAIFPVELRSVLSPDPLRILFLMLLEMMESNGSFKNAFHQNTSYVLFQLQTVVEEEKIFSVVNSLHLSPPHLVCLHLKVLNTTYLGYIYFSEDLIKQETFKNALNLSGIFLDI